jgi:hypothetical protein
VGKTLSSRVWHVPVHISPLYPSIQSIRRKTRILHTHIYTTSTFLFFTMCVYTLWPAVDHLQNHHHHDDDYEETRWASSSLISHLLHHLRISLNHTHIYTVVGQRERTMYRASNLYILLPFLYYYVYYIRVLLCWKSSRNLPGLLQGRRRLLILFYVC